MVEHTSRMNEYQVVGRMLPSATSPTPKLYRMRLFAPNEIVAKSRFWHFLKKLKRVKRANGEVVACNQIHERRGGVVVKNFGVWLRYDSRSGTHNMYKEYRDVSRCGAVNACYQEMASRHRARFSSIQIIRVGEIKSADVRRPFMRQLIQPKLKFPLPHRVQRAESRTHRPLFLGIRPTTCV